MIPTENRFSRCRKDLRQAMENLRDELCNDVVFEATVKELLDSVQPHKTTGRRDLKPVHEFPARYF